MDIVKLSAGVVLGNLISFAVILAVSPYIKVERRIVTRFF
jgi:hypothetical protein